MNGDSQIKDRTMLFNQYSIPKENENKRNISMEFGDRDFENDTNNGLDKRKRMESYSMTSYKTIGEDGEEVIHKNGFIMSKTSLLQEQKEDKPDTLESKDKWLENSFETEINKKEKGSNNNTIKKTDNNQKRKRQHSISFFTKLIHQDKTDNPINYKLLYQEEKQKVKDRDELIIKLKNTNTKATSDKIELIKNYEGLIRKLKRVNENDSHRANKTMQVEIVKEQPRKEIKREKSIKKLTRKRSISIDDNTKYRKLSFSKEKFLQRFGPSIKRITIKDEIVFDFKDEYK